MPAAAWNVTEVGLFAQVGADPEILLAYWTSGGEVLAAATPGVTLVLAAVIEIQAANAEIAVTLNPAVTITGASTFFGLTDTPAAAASQFLRVNSAADALLGLSAAQLVAALPAATAASRGTIQLRDIPRTALASATGSAIVEIPAWRLSDAGGNPGRGVRTSTIVTTQEFTFEPRAVYTGAVEAFLIFHIAEKTAADFTGDTFQDPAYSLGAETAGHSTASEQPPPTRRWLQGLSIGN